MQQFSMQSQNQPNLGSPICGILIIAILSGFFGSYAYNPPNPVNCFAGPDSTLISPVKTDLQPKNVTAEFHSFFQWMFVLYMIQLVVHCIQVLGAITKNASLFMCGYRILAIVGCTYFAVIITGTVYRFRNEGRVCSGEFEPTILEQPYVLEKEGQFIKVWTILFYSLFGCICCCACLFVVVAMKGARGH